ncbi:MAG TPA: hypothetical protein VK508_21865 [Cyclobacteriaceae bacterium]|nr:hypothetical protein [Cyclobacteriaceae bacterium]
MKLSYSKGNEWLKILLYSIISAYIVYQQASNADAITVDEQIMRHQRLLDGNSEFFNPWQYRVFSTYFSEAFANTVQYVIPSMGKGTAFLGLRFIQNIAIFLLAGVYFRRLGIENPWLRLTGNLIMGFCMAHSTFASDLSINTYFDITFYLIAALLILKGKYFWTIPLMLVAALNRETSALIPAMLIIPAINWKERLIDRKRFWSGVAAGGIFVVVFFSVRAYYGYREAMGINDMTNVMEFLIYNLKFKRMYIHLIGTLGFLPIVVMLFLNKLSPTLRMYFWIVVPAWFVIHLCYSAAVESRLFLVPQALIFVPAFLQIVDRWYSERNPGLEVKS